MLTIRRAGQEDKEAIWRVHGEAIRGTCASHYSREVIEIWAGRLRPEKYAEAIDKYEFFVAEEGGLRVVVCVPRTRPRHGNVIYDDAVFQAAQTRVDLAACYRLVANFGWSDLVFTHITARVPGEEDRFLIEYKTRPDMPEDL